MRILYLVPYAPNLIRVRPYQLIRALARRGHEVEVAALWSSREEEDGLRQLARENATIRIRARRLPPWRPVWNCLRVMSSRIPFQAAYSYDPGLLCEVGKALGERSFDVVHVEHLRGSIFGLNIRRLLSDGRRNDALRSRVPVVWDCVDCISHLFAQASRASRSLKGRWMTRLELPRTRRFEGWLATQFDHTLTASAGDREALRALAGRQGTGEAPKHSGAHGSLSITVLPNGVDLDYFRPSTEARDPATLVFAGKMSYHANLTAAFHLLQEIMPLVWRERPDAQVVIAGKDPPRSLLALAAVSEGRGANSHSRATCGGERVKVTGTVPDLRPYLQRATVSVAPVVYGAGIQNKVLEAMACATPVIASSRAAAALSARAGRDLLVADDPAAFALEILALLADDSRRRSIGSAGRAYVEAHHDWQAIAGLLESAYLNAIAAAREERLRPAFPGVTAGENLQ